MDDTSVYDTDILVWSEQQAAALRSLAARHDLPNGLDLANVVEEIEDVGKSEFRTVESFIRNILVHLIMLRAEPDALSVRGWRGEVTAWHVDLLRRISPSMRARVDVDEIWGDAIRIACAKLEDWNAERAERVQTALAGTACPLDIGALCAAEFDIPAAAAKLPAV
jgi:hypothetical protein